MLRFVRIVVLLFVLVVVAHTAWTTRSRSVEWKFTLPVAIHPINGDGSAAAARYIDALREDDVQPIAAFMRREAQRHGIGGSAIVGVRLGARIGELPPAPPQGGHALSIMLWSLRMRYWAWRAGSGDGALQVRMFVLYFDPARTTKLAHSLGLRKGLIGVVNAFAREDMTQDNNVIIAHELLHTLGASDKYDPATNLPLFPDGYAEPALDPLLPQRKAEIMAGRIALARDRAEAPRSLDEAVVGDKTAEEINWLGAAAK